MPQTRLLIVSLAVAVCGVAGCEKDEEVAGVPPGPGGGGWKDRGWPVVAQFDGADGFDIATTDSKRVVVTYGLSSLTLGHWKLAREHNLGFVAGAVAAADFNGDGRVDLAIANKDGSTVAILLHTASGPKTSPLFSSTVIACGKGPHLLAAGDLDGDNDADLVVYSEDQQKMDVFRNDGSGNLTLATTMLSVPKVGRCLAIGQFGRFDESVADTYADIAFVYRDPDTTGHSGPKLNVYRGDNKMWGAPPTAVTNTSLDDDLGDVRPGKGLPTDDLGAELQNLIGYTTGGSAIRLKFDGVGKATKGMTFDGPLTDTPPPTD